MVNRLFQLRVLTAVIGIPVLLALVYFGGLPLFAAVVVTAVIGIDEIFRAFSRVKADFSKITGYLGSLLFLFLVYYIGDTAIPAVLFLVMFILLVQYVVTYPQLDFKGVGVTLFVSIYLGLFFSFVFLLRQMDKGFFFLLLAFLLAWANDVGGYLVGNLWGKRKLAAALSPNKTREGSVGGLCLSVITAVIAFFIASVPVNLIKVVALGLVAGFAGQIGDLVASAIKRQTGIKDYGSILPGHGGVLDRFDSFLLIAPLVYYYLVLFIID
jgi:phosphatidate cytidylyltransferase